MKEINKPIKSKKIQLNGFRKSSNKTVKKLQLMLNESLDFEISKIMRLFKKETPKTTKNKKNKSKGIQKMKKTKTIKALIIIAVLIIPLLLGWKINEAAQKNRENGISNNQASGEYQQENSEVFFKPGDDTRNWHIINHRVSMNGNDTLDCNNSVYLFNKDSVLVINDFIAFNDDTAGYLPEEIFVKK